MSATEPTFSELEGRVLTLFGEGDLDGALEVTRDASLLFPDRLSFTAFWTACIRGVAGDSEGALDALRDALDQSDVWWGRELLEEDPDLQGLPSVAGFADLVDECERRGRTARKRARVEWVAIEPAESSVPRVVLVALHGRTGNLADLGERWRVGADAGATVVIVQSSQMMADGMHCWDDLEVAERDVAEALHATVGSEAAVVLGGFSQGGGVAARIALLRDPVPAAGFVSIAPSFHRPGVRLGDLADSFTRAANEGVRGWLAIGERDQRYRAPAEEVELALRDAGIPTRCLLMSRRGHEYPEPFPQVLAGALSFVLNWSSTESSITS